jgi:hypothetical protein
VRISIKVRREVGAEVGIKVDTKVRMTTAEKIRFKVRVSSFGKS